MKQRAKANRSRMGLDPLFFCFYFIMTQCGLQNLPRSDSAYSRTQRHKLWLRYPNSGFR